MDGVSNFQMLQSDNTWDLADGGTAVDIRNSNTVMVDGMTVVGNGGRAINVYNSHNVTVDHLETCGMNEGVYFQYGSGHTVQNSSFSEAAAGVSVYPNTTVQLIDNTFHNVGTEASFNPINTNVTISGSQTVSSAPWCPAPANATPVADAGVDQTHRSIDPSMDITLDGSASSDADGDNLTYTWSGGFGTTSGVSPTITLGLGVHNITLTVTDPLGASSTDDVVIAITHGLVAYWKADGNGTDDTGNGNDVTSGGSSAVTYGVGADNQAFEFSGSNWMEKPDASSLDIGTGDLAIVLWAKLSGANGVETLLDKRDPNDGYRGYVVYTINNGYVGAQINVGNSYTNWISPFNIADNEWHHIVFTIDRDNPTGGLITVDGTETYTFDPTPYAGNVDNAGPLRIGGRNDGSENWVGSIDDIRLYNYAFTPDEILDDFDNVTPPPTNEAPVAEAGDDQSEDCSSVFTLDGSGSTDDGDLTYSWMLSDILLVNGSFEDGMNGWTHTGVSGQGGNSIDLGNWAGAASDGAWLLDLVGTGNPVGGYVEQTIDTDVGAQYVLNFDVKTNGSSSLEVTIDGVPGSQIFSSAGAFTSYSTSFTATSSATTIRLGADGAYNYWGNSVFLDNVSVDGEVSSSASFTTTTLPTGSYTYTLTVTDAFGETDSDDVTVTVAADVIAPTLTLNGDNPASVLINNPYSDGGASAYTAEDNCDVDVQVDVSGTVDTGTLGSYTITYTATDDAGNTTQATRTVEVLNTPPVADAGSDQLVECVIESTDIDLDGSASSDADGDGLTYSWTLDGTEVSTFAAFTASLSAGSYTYTLTVSDGTDSSSDDVLVTVVDDTEPPVLTLLGDNPMDLGLYLEYVEAGYETEDACGSEVTVVVAGGVDVNTPGSYTISYTATDENGNASTEERVVEVFNTAPEVVNAADDIELSFGDDVLSASLDMSAIFADVDPSDVLTYTYTNEDEGVAISSQTGSILTFDAVDLGETLVEITATDPWGASASQALVVTVNVSETLAGALLFANDDIDLKKEVEVNSGNILVNEAYVYGGDDDGLGKRGRGGDDDDDDNDDGDDDDDDEGDDEDDDHDHDNAYGHYELRIDKDVIIASGYMLMADGIQIKKDASISSDVHANDLDNRGDIYGDIYNTVETPLFTTLPPFKSAQAGSQNITVNRNQSLTLEPGDYGRIMVKDRGSLTFTGGVYNIEKLEVDKYSHIRFEEASEVRVEEKMKIAKQSYVGPAGGSFIDASDIIFYIDNGYHGEVKLEQRVVFYGTIYAPEREVKVKKNGSFTGSILADRIEISKETELFLDSYFSLGGGSLAKGDRIAWIEPEMAVEIPETSSLASNYPNPFNPSTTIDFALNNDANISLKIYNIRGAEVAELANGFHEAGHYTVHFTPVDLSSGTYLYVLDTGSFREVKRMVYLK